MRYCAVDNLSEEEQVWQKGHNTVKEVCGIVRFHKENLKNKPLVIGIIGNPKFISNDALKKETTDSVLFCAFVRFFEIFSKFPVAVKLAV
jgi:hypothetical protein